MISFFQSNSINLALMGEAETVTVTVTDMVPQSLLERLKDYGQEDTFAFWDELSPDERQLLVKDIEVA